MLDFVIRYGLCTMNSVTTNLMFIRFLRWHCKWTGMNCVILLIGLESLPGLFWSGSLRSGGRCHLILEHACWHYKVKISIFTFELIYSTTWGTRWHIWLGHCATSRQVAGSIPDDVIGISHWHNPSGRTMALGLTQPLTEMSTRNISWGIKAAGADNLTTFMWRLSWNLGVSTSWNPQGLSRPVMGLLKKSKQLLMCFSILLSGHQFPHLQPLKQTILTGGIYIQELLTLTCNRISLPFILYERPDDKLVN